MTTTTTETGPNPYPDTIRASIDNGALKHVTEFSNGTLSDFLTEACQNARRAGALTISIKTTDDAGLIIRDDGSGIRNPGMLLKFGGTEWDPGTQRRVKPAGMGSYSLTRCTALITSRPAGADTAWAVTLKPEHYRGEELALVSTISAETVPLLSPSGTEIRVSLYGLIQDPYDHQPSRLRKTIEETLRYSPITVILNGSFIPKRHFIERAEAVKIWNGLKIGIGPASQMGMPGGPFHNANTNVFGQLVRTPAPRINTLKERNNAYTVRIDAMDCPSLQVVLPARKEVVKNEFSRKLYQACEKMILKHLAENGTPVPGDVAKLAEQHGITFKTPEIRLERWRPPDTSDASDALHTEPYMSPRREIVPEDAVIVPAPDTIPRNLARPLARAMCESTNGQAKQRMTLMVECNELAGYAAYDRIPRLAAIEATCIDPADGIERTIKDFVHRQNIKGWRRPQPIGEAGAVLPRVDRITLSAHAETQINGRKLVQVHPFDVPVVCTDPNHPATWSVLATKDAEKTVNADNLRDMLTDTYFWRPAEDDDRQSDDEFRVSMTNIALTVIYGNDEIRRRKMLLHHVENMAQQFAPLGSETLIRIRRPRNRTGLDIKVTFEPIDAANPSPTT